MAVGLTCCTITLTTSRQRYASASTKCIGIVREVRHKHACHYDQAAVLLLLTSHVCELVKQTSSEARECYYIVHDNEQESCHYQLSSREHSK